MELHKYRLYCETEEENVESYGYQETVPTVCPHNTAHTIDDDSIVILDTITDHDVNVLTEPAYAVPDYRTKRDGAGPFTCVKNDDTTIDFKLTQELYVSGGYQFVWNCEKGDWFEAMVYDKDSIIPEAYRAAMCEDWPIVSQYVLKTFYPAEGEGNLTKCECNTYPLSAAISAGLYLRIIYHAVDDGISRSVYNNFYFTKKI